MRFLLLLVAIISLISARPETKFRDGECGFFWDQPSQRMDREMIVRVEGFKNGKYLYRWWTFSREWALDLGTVMEEQKLFDRVFRKVLCPSYTI